MCFWLVTLVNVVMVFRFSDVQQRHLQSDYESTYGSGLLSNVNFFNGCVPLGGLEVVEYYFHAFFPATWL